LPVAEITFAAQCRRGHDFISTQPWLSIAVGFVTGFTFPYVRDIVTQFKPERRDAAPANGGANIPQGNSDKKGKG
jgi:hypothetical protein